MLKTLGLWSRTAIECKILVIYAFNPRLQKAEEAEGSLPLLGKLCLDSKSHERETSNPLLPKKSVAHCKQSLTYHSSHSLEDSSVSSNMATRTMEG